MAYRYIISNRAQNDLDNIIEYMAFELQEIKAAKNLSMSIIKTRINLVFLITIHYRQC